MYDSSNAGGQEHISTPAMLIDRARDPKRLLQAARALNVLEADLRTLLEKVPFTEIGRDVVDYAVTAYQSLRGVVVDLLDDEGRVSADDEALGMPIIEDDATFSTLLLKLSQATRFVSVEEAWPGTFIMTRLQSQQFKEQLSAIDKSAGGTNVGVGGVMPLKGIGPGDSSGPGYL